MSNIREFSIVRRRKNLVDILIPRVDDTSQYEFEVADNFDAAYSQIFVVPQASGFLDANVDRRVLTKATVPGNAKVRAVFDPDTYAPGDITNGDDGHFWLRMVRVVASTGASEPATPGVLVITEGERQAQQHYPHQRSELNLSPKCGQAGKEAKKRPHHQPQAPKTGLRALQGGG